MPVFRTLCPAKINLRLKIGSPDASGMHPLETEFQAISLYDVLEVRTSASGFECDDPSLPADNTVSKAHRLAREAVALPEAAVRLSKVIPAQAGLGGGSSDAAGLLRILQKLAPRSVPSHVFASAAAAVGADVPFFLVGGRAKAAGYGEQLTPLEDQPSRWLTVAVPDIGCSTPAMYKALDDHRGQNSSTSVPAGLLENDFHAVMPEESLRLIQVLQSLGLGPCSLSGSGSAVFGFADDQAAAEQAAVSLGLLGIRAYACRTLSRQESLAIEQMA